MRATIVVIGLILAGALVVGPGGASAADEQATLQAISRDTGVTVETLQEQKTTTGFSYGDLRMGHLVAEAVNRPFEDVSRQFKGGQPWHEIAGAEGLSLKDVERIAQRRRLAKPEP
jgi:hypothetical protein